MSSSLGIAHLVFYFFTHFPSVGAHSTFGWEGVVFFSSIAEVGPSGLFGLSPVLTPAVSM